MSAGPRPPPAAFVDAPEALRLLAERVAGLARVALDTEANSLHAYRERVCVVQLSTDHESAIIDPLVLPDLAPLGAALARTDLEVVLHGGDYDIAVLSRDHGIALGRVFDTHVAATLLGEPRVGLADLAATHLGVQLDKRFQTADWGRRPLTPEQLVYLQGDTQWLLPLRDLLAARLRERDLEEEAEIEFRRLALRRGRPLATDPEGWRRLKGASELGAEGRAVLAALWTWRESEAERRDLPPFKVLAPQALLAVAQRPPPDDPRAPLTGLHPREVARHGGAVRGAVRRGLEAARAGQAPPPPERPVLGEAQRRERKQREQVEDRLRAWRREEAAARGVPNVVVLPNPALEHLAEHADRYAAADPSELAALPDVGPKRAARYGEALRRLLRAP